MSSWESDESEFVWYWYQLVWALEGFDHGPEGIKDYPEPREMCLLLRDALARLERAMDRNLLAELRQKHRRKVAAREWSALNKRLRSLEHSAKALAPGDADSYADPIKQIEDEKMAIRGKLTLLEEELGEQEISRIRRAKPLPLCGTAVLRASQWTAQKQHDEDGQLLHEVEELLAGRDRLQ